jgi:integrase
MRLDNLIKLFVRQHCPSLKPRTAKYYARALEVFGQDFGNVEVANLRASNFMNWLNAHPQWKQSRRKLWWQLLQAMLNWAVRNDLLDRNHLTGKVRLPATKKRGWESIPTKEEYHAIRQRSPDWYKDYLDLLYFTGRRPNDVREVQAYDIDFKMGIWTLQNHKTAELCGQLEIVLCPEALEIFARLAGKYPRGRLLRTARGYRLMQSECSRKWVQLRDKLGLRKTIVPYGLRHLLATDLVSAGVPINEVAALLGHKSTATTQNVYVHLCQDRAKLRDALSRR